MGWSCSQLAGVTLDKLSAACVKQTGSQNVFRVETATKPTFYMFETSNREHDDGKITGEVMMFVGDPTGQDSCPAVPAGRFTISGDGKLVRAPHVLKHLALSA